MVTQDTRPVHKNIKMCVKGVLALEVSPGPLVHTDNLRTFKEYVEIQACLGSKCLATLCANNSVDKVLLPCLFIFVFCGRVDWTQGLEHARAST